MQQIYTYYGSLKLPKMHVKFKEDPLAGPCRIKRKKKVNKNKY